jgi:Cys-rich protein (TIGR01571 family)
MIRVVAPAKLEEGFVFDVMVDDVPFNVIVPRGGVKEGQEFDVPFTCNLDESERSSTEQEVTLAIQSSSEECQEFDEQGTPLGRWRTSLCACCDVVTQATFWMGFCCTPILVAQLLTRLRLTWRGHEGPPEEISLSFNRIVVSMIITMAFANILMLGAVFSVVFFLCVVVVVGTNVRRHVRKKYKIPKSLPTKWGDSVDDCCCMLWCGCCSSIQIARHTHDDLVYPGAGCTTTGLDILAPQLL